MKFRRFTTTAVLAGLSAVSLHGVANAEPDQTQPAHAAPANPSETTDKADKDKTKDDQKTDENKPSGKDGLTNDPKEVLGSIADLLAFLPGVLPQGEDSAQATDGNSAQGSKLPQNLDELSGSASDLLSSNDKSAPSDSTTKPADVASEDEAADTEKVTVPAKDEKPVLPTGKAAAERVIAQKEKEAGHDLVDVNFVDNKTASISLAETFDQQADADALKEIAQVLHDNGFTVTAERSAK